MAGASVWINIGVVFAPPVSITGGVEAGILHPDSAREKSTTLTMTISIFLVIGASPSLVCS
jgi:Sec-independent protein secretion pathway component TatC